MGLRPSEAVRANVCDWDFEAGTLRVRGKGGKFRILPSDPEVVRWVRMFVPVELALSAAPLFGNPRADQTRNPESRWTKAASRRVWRAACVVVGVYFKPNEGLRHAFATHAVNRGVPLDRTGAYLGHREVRTTRRYARLAERGLVDVLRPAKRSRTVAGPD
jgi:integrase